MNKIKIFIVEDDLWYLQVLEYYLSRGFNYEIIRFSTAKECLEQMHQLPHLVILDYNLPDANGLMVLKSIKTISKEIPVIVISASDDPEVTKALLEEGAVDFFVKDEHTRELLLNSIGRILEHHRLKFELEQLKMELGQKYSIQNIALGESASIKKVYALVDKASKSNINVSLSGETGTGKRLFARAIHFNSERSARPFVAIDLSSIPKNFVDIELFGHETKSIHGQNGLLSKGKLAQAEGGTLFLENVAELDLAIQAKLLQLLEEKSYFKVGGEQLLPADVRIITSSDRDLLEVVKEQKFREDLFYALMGLPINLPPLRKRGTDIILLAKHFLEMYCKNNHLSLKKLTPKACEKLLSYNYPGNLHELKAILQLATVMSDSEQIEPDDILLSSTTSDGNWFAEEKTMREYTKSIIQAFLRNYNGNVLKVAEKLDIGKSTIYKMIQDGEIVP